MSILAQNTGVASNGGLGDIGGTEYRWGQSFSLSENALITSVEIYFGSTTGAPSGGVTCRIETDSSGPSNTLVDVNATKNITPSASDWNTFAFGSSFQIAKTTTLWIVLRCDNQSNDNFWRTNIATDGDYAGGTAYISLDGGSSWADSSGYDLTFKLNGTLLIPNKTLFFGCNF